MNELIEKIFNGFTVDGIEIPVSFMYYEGHGEPYITYMQIDADSSYSGDDELLGYADYYDFDVYSKSDYTNIIESVKSILKENDIMFSPSMSSSDMYEPDTGYYHKTLCFMILRQES